MGRWRIHSQSLDGEQLEAADWITPKVKPSPREHISKRVARANTLNAQLLENPPGPALVLPRTPADLWWAQAGQQHGKLVFVREMLVVHLSF